MVPVILPFVFAAMIGVPFVCSFVLPIMAEAKSVQLIGLVVAPAIFILATLLTGLFFAFPTKKAIVPGKFERNLNHPVYGARRVYGAAWTSIFYNTPLYHTLLAVNPLRKVLFRVYGYTGPLDFTTYPDTWLRDLPCLMFESKAYLANKATLGTNLLLADGTILIDRIKAGERAIVGHLSVVGCGTKFRAGSEFGLQCASGIRAEFKAESKLNPCSTVHHGVLIGERTVVGCSSYIGTRTEIAADIKIEAASVIPKGLIIKNQKEADEWRQKERQELNEARHSAFSQGSKLFNPTVGQVREIRNAEITRTTGLITQNGTKS